MSWDDYKKRTEFSNLVGHTLTEVVGAEAGSDEIRFVSARGDVFRQTHLQDCCESVNVAEVIGDLDSIIGHEIVEAREESNNDNPPHEKYNESWTWTFYTIRTNRGTVVIRWLGESNGYYSESVDTLHDPA